VPDIVDTAVAAGSFTNLVAAIKAAGLVDTLKNQGPFTVFAPNDAAFAKLPPGTVDNLLKDAPQLKLILSYHVVAGRMLSQDVLRMKDAITIGGDAVKFDSSLWEMRRNLKVNEAEIIKSDIIADNGVIHVIDRVLMPPIAMTH
jgi:uncharacterized surface protein with fasciclin (FAS1) repeats